MVSATVRPQSSRTNLPVQLTSFVGRMGEVDQITRALAGTRLLTLTGPGGIGKTRLAVQVAASREAITSEDVVLVELAAVADPSLVAQAVASALGLAEVPGRPTIEAIISAVAERQLLLVLDNCEHLLDGCAALVERLLRACPHLDILATSREPLGIAGEQRWLVPPMELPPIDVAFLGADGASGASAFNEVGVCESIRLFVDRARQVHAQFALTLQNAPFVARICRDLDGIPLAIELAAARAHVLTPEQIAPRLGNRLALLVRGSRSAPARQHTLRATIDWSHALLGSSERELFRRLAVFAGGWTLEAAETVAGHTGTLDLLTSLVDRSLVQVQTEHGESRYRFLHVVREYAEDQLVESGEETEFRNRHLQGVLGLAEQAEPALLGPDQAAWLNRLEVEIENVRAALTWSMSAQAGSTGAFVGLRVAGALWRIWFFRGYRREGVRWPLIVRTITRTASYGHNAFLVRSTRLQETFSVLELRTMKCSRLRGH